jgi:hypothetical protein
MIPLGEEVRKRHRHRTERGRVIHFSVQLELWFADSWQPVVRYDAAHGFAHRDMYETPSRKRKEHLKVDLATALTEADR